MIKVAVPITGKEEFNALKKVILSGKFVSGENVKNFEKEYAKYIGVKYAVAVNSGTAALHTALASLGLKKGDEVIVPSISFVSSATAILHQGCIPRFCDVDLSNYCMSTESLEKNINKKTKAILPVHFAGSACEMKKIIKIAKKYNLEIIEDCAQAHGTKYFGKKVGAFGKISCFSFYATKHMTTGEGGIICTNDKKIYNFCKVFRNHGMKDRDTHFQLGFNYRMSELNAAIGRVQLKKLNKINRQRINNSLYILNKLKKTKNSNNWFEIQKPIKHIYHTYFWCPIRILSKKITIDQVKNRLRKKGIEIRARYKFPLYGQKVFHKIKNKKTQDYKNLKLLNSEKLDGKIFGLPNHYKLKKKHLDYIVKTLESLFEK